MRGARIITNESGNQLIAFVYGASEIERDAKAAFIMRACNAHGELLDILKSVASDLAWGTTAKYKGAGSDYIFAAIAKAAGK